MEESRTSSESRKAVFSGKATMLQSRGRVEAVRFKYNVHHVGDGK